MEDDRIIRSDKTNNFRPKSIYDMLSYFQFQTDFFSYFWKITTDSVFHNVKKQVGQKWPFPVVKGLIPFFWEIMCDYFVARASGY